MDECVLALRSLSRQACRTDVQSALLVSRLQDTSDQHSFEFSSDSEDMGDRRRGDLPAGALGARSSFAAHMPEASSRSWAVSSDTHADEAHEGLSSSPSEQHVARTQGSPYRDAPSEPSPSGHRDPDRRSGPWAHDAVVRGEESTESGDTWDRALRRSEREGQREWEIERQEMMRVQRHVREHPVEKQQHGAGGVDALLEHDIAKGRGGLAVSRDLDTRSGSMRARVDEGREAGRGEMIGPEEETREREGSRQEVREAEERERLEREKVDRWRWEAAVQLGQAVSKEGRLGPDSADGSVNGTSHISKPSGNLPEHPARERERERAREKEKEREKEK